MEVGVGAPSEPHSDEEKLQQVAVMTVSWALLCSLKLLDKVSHWKIFTVIQRYTERRAVEFDCFD